MPTDTRLLLIDGHALVHRAFHALPEDLQTSSGEPTNAVFGFASMLLKAIETIQPSHIIMALDRPVPTFRHQEFEEYKATRPRTPQLLSQQFGRVREVAEAMNIPLYEQDGFEADDVIGTLSAQADGQSLPTTILTGDLDTLQLVSDHVHVLTARRGIADTTLYDLPAVHRRYGLDPAQLPDFKGLVGDKSDNIPGVPGIGEKTASNLLREHGSLESLYDHLDALSARLRQALDDNRVQVFQSRRLATIVRNVPVTLELGKAAWHDVNRTRVINLFRELEFRTLIERVQTMLPVAAPPAEPERPEAEATQLSIFGQVEEPSPVLSPLAVEEQDGNVVAALNVLQDLGSAPAQTVTHVVRAPEQLAGMVETLQGVGQLALDTETTSTDPLRAGLVGLSFAVSGGRAWYVPVGHVEGDQIPLLTVLDTLRPLLEDNRLLKVGHNLKYDYTVLLQHGVQLQGIAFDTMIAAYLLNTSGRGLSLSALALARLGIEMTPIESLIGKGKAQITMDRVPIAPAAAYAGADADVCLRLYEIFRQELEERGLTALFHDVEMPLVTVLADMERSGVALDTSVLAELSREMTETIADLEARIYETAGRRFNINSTQQLGQVLFGQLQLPSGRKTKTGYSTDSEVLEGLRGKHPIVDDILEYRQLIKLKNTYVDSLPSLINPDTGRVHTDFNQTVASTGRLSSSNPNLQNIPIRGEVGRRIRRAFVPYQTDHVLLAADYSQIELRILAAMSGDEQLVDAFRSGQDIHRATASAVFGVPLSEVTPDQRRIAKVVNFGIIYGIGEGRLAYETGISRSEAREFMATYNSTYAGVKTFMDNMRKRAALYGYVTTLLHRRRDIPDIHSPHPGIRTAAERAAINMPIQGTAADIIKLAMIRVHHHLQERYPEASMVLQVHDELVFDVAAGEVDEIAALVRQDMEHAMELDVPLEVEVKVGHDWYDMRSPQPALA